MESCDVFVTTFPSARMKVEGTRTILRTMEARRIASRPFAHRSRGHANFLLIDFARTTRCER